MLPRALFSFCGLPSEFRSPPQEPGGRGGFLVGLGDVLEDDAGSVAFAGRPAAGHRSVPRQALAGPRQSSLPVLQGSRDGVGERDRGPAEQACEVPAAAGEQCRTDGVDVDVDEDLGVGTGTPALTSAWRNCPAGRSW